MGDRVSLTLTIPSHHYDAARQIIEQYDGDGYEAEEFEQFTDYEFNEVNYGNLECEEHLTAAGIAWMKSWGAGGGFTAGTAWVMFNEDGSIHQNSLNDTDPMSVLLPLFDVIDNPEEVIRQLQLKKKEMLAPSWENQVEYGKRYLAATLINPPQTDSAPT